jgi:hypothetical protein
MLVRLLGYEEWQIDWCVARSVLGYQQHHQVAG